MKCVVDLSEVEEITLQQLSINHRHRDARTCAAGLLQLGRNVKLKVIAEQRSVSDQSVYKVLVQIGSANRLELLEQNELITGDDQAEESGGVVRWTPF